MQKKLRSTTFPIGHYFSVHEVQTKTTYKVQNYLPQTKNYSDIYFFDLVLTIRIKVSNFSYFESSFFLTETYRNYTDIM